MTSVLGARYIYEFDLKNFFGEIRVAQVLTYLEGLGLGKEFSRQIAGMATMQAKIPEAPMMDETNEYKKNF